MRKINYLLTLGLLCTSLATLAQKENVGIGTTKPDQSALLDLSSQTKGLLTPRMSLEQRGNIQNPANGLMVYQTDFLSGFYYFDGKEWKSMTNATNASSVAGVDGDWVMGGNGTIAGSPTEAKLGYFNDIPFKLEVNSNQAGLIDKNKGLSFYGFLAGRDNSTGINNTAIGKNALRANSTGANNMAVGSDAMVSSVSGNNNLALGAGSLANANGASDNTAIGSQALFTISTGGNNVGLGTKALFKNQTGTNNVGIGIYALYETLGSNNVGIGAAALTNNNASNNIGIGTEAGFSNLTGTGNVFLGRQAGYSEVGSNKLYIANTSTTQPTIYGDFSANFVSIGNNITLAKRDAIATAGSYGLLVEKGILTEKLKVATIASADWADYVFDEKYTMLPLEEVEKFVKANKHLPNVPSAEEMSKNGLDVVTSDSKLLEKIEELTLYMIEMNKEIKALKAENAKLKK